MFVDYDGFEGIVCAKTVLFISFFDIFTQRPLRHYRKLLRYTIMDLEKHLSG